MGLYGLIDVFVIRLSSNGATLLTHTPDFTRSSITSGRNLRPPWLLGPVSRKNSLNSFFSLYKNPIDLNLNPISSESDEIGIQLKCLRWLPVLVLLYFEMNLRVKSRPGMQGTGHLKILRSCLCQAGESAPCEAGRGGAA